MDYTDCKQASGIDASQTCSALTSDPAKGRLSRLIRLLPPSHDLLFLLLFSFYSRVQATSTPQAPRQRTGVHARSRST